MRVGSRDAAALTSHASSLVCLWHAHVVSSQPCGLCLPVCACVASFSCVGVKEAWFRSQKVTWRRPHRRRFVGLCVRALVQGLPVCARAMEGLASPACLCARAWRRLLCLRTWRRLSVLAFPCVRAAPSVVCAHAASAVLLGCLFFVRRYWFWHRICG